MVRDHWVYVMFSKTESYGVDSQLVGLDPLFNVPDSG